MCPWSGRMKLWVTHPHPHPHPHLLHHLHLVRMTREILTRKFQMEMTISKVKLNLHTVCLFVYLSVWVFVCLCFCLFVDLSVCVFVCLSICLFVFLSVCGFVSLCICSLIQILCIRTKFGCRAGQSARGGSTCTWQSAYQHAGANQKRAKNIKFCLIF